MTALTRKELIDAVRKTAELLDDEQLAQATTLLDELAFPEQTATRQPKVTRLANAEAFDEFIAELSAQIRASSGLS